MINSQFLISYSFCDFHETPVACYSGIITNEIVLSIIVNCKSKYHYHSKALALSLGWCFICLCHFNIKSPSNSAIFGARISQIILSMFIEIYNDWYDLLLQDEVVNGIGNVCCASKIIKKIYPIISCMAMAYNVTSLLSFTSMIRYECVIAVR